MLYLKTLSLQDQYIYLAVPLSVTFIFLAILFNGMEFDGDAEVVRYKKSVVETGSMTLFAIACFVVYRMRIGEVDFRNTWRVFGATVVYVSLAINILGRIWLKSNWSNQIRVKSTHTLVCSGPYKVVRHPLYTTTITMIYGAALVYGNISVLILNTLIFIPMMIYRARQEESALSELLDVYSEYQRRVPMLMPSVFKFYKQILMENQKEVR